MFGIEGIPVYYHLRELSLERFDCTLDYKLSPHTRTNIQVRGK